MALFAVAFLATAWRPARLPAACFGAGLIWTACHVHVRLADRLAPELQAADVSVSGWVDEFPRPASGQVTFSLRVSTSSPGSGVPGRLRLTWYDPPVPVSPAAAYELVVRLKPPRGLVNPGGFDYERWAFEEGYGAAGYVRRGRPLDDAGRGVRRRWLGLRARLAERIETSALTGNAAALMIALTLGERVGFSDSHWRVLRRTGTSHLFAISGLHVGLVAGIVFFVCRRLVLRLPGAMAGFDLELAGFASMVGAIVYAALAGFTVPTQRAIIMLAVALAALVSRRSIGIASGLSTALLSVLVWDPLAPLSASFWLSFGAVVCLLRIARRERRTGARGRWICELARLQWSMSLALIPIVAFFFLEVSLVAPAVNLVAIPLFSFLLVPLSLLSALLVLLHPAGEIVVAVSGALMQWTWDRLVPIAEWPWAATTVSGPSVWAMGLSLMGVVAALSYPLPARYLGWLALLPIFFTRPPRLVDGSVVVEVLDVGHGLAVLVETREHTMVYDAGPRYRSGFDAGEEIVVPATRTKGWRSLDMLMVSHADNDHAGGAHAVVEAYPDARIVMGPDVSLAGGTICESGQTWTWDGVHFEILHPDEGFRRRGNESSCVLKVTFGTGGLLLTGDIEVAGEHRLLARREVLAAEVVVVPHHGSATSSSAALVVATDASYALVSAGHRNQWGFPRPEVAARWEQAGARVISTGQAGAIRVSFDPLRGVEVVERRSLRRRYWSAVP